MRYIISDIYLSADFDKCSSYIFMLKFTLRLSSLAQIPHCGTDDSRGRRQELIKRFFRHVFSKHDFHKNHVYMFYASFTYETKYRHW